MISTCFVLISIYFFQVFIDFAIYERVTVFTSFFGILIGILLGSLFSVLPLNLVWQNSLLGLVPSLAFSSNTASLILFVSLGLMDLAIIRFLFLALAFVKNNQNITNHHLMRQFIWALFLGPFIYINLNIVKRFLPAFFGLDFSALAIFYAILMGLYIKKHELFYFLPGTLERAILISNAGLALFDFNFKTQQVEDLSNNPQGFGEFEILHNLFYSTTAAIEQTFKRGPEGKRAIKKHCFQEIASIISYIG